jgi:ABC-type Fe3+ transport system permease subunit
VNWTLLQNSLLMAGLTTACAVTLGIVAAIFVGGLERRTRLVFIGVAVAAFALPPFLVTNCWMRWFGLTGIARNWIPFDLYSLGGAVVILTGMLWPLTLLLTLASWSRLDRSLFDSEPGLAGVPLLRRLLLPAALSSIQQSVVITFVLALNNFAVPSLLQVKVFTVEVFV